MRAAELVSEEPASVDRWGTGLAGLDRLVGGFRRGQLWVITGAPAVGKSLLLLQLVFRLAVEHRFTTEYAGSTADDADLIRSRLLSLATKRSPSLPDLVVPLDAMTDRQTATLEAMRSAELDVSIGRGFALARWDTDWDLQRCFAVDDPELRREPVLDEVGRRGLRSLADAGGVVLTTVPRSHCLEAGEHRDRLREEWSAVAEVIVEIVPREAGAAVLRVWQNRRGPQGDVEVVSQPHWARFVDSHP